MPKNYTPTAEHLAALGYAPDAEHTVEAWGCIGYSRRVPAPCHPYYATLVVQVFGDGTVFLTRLARTRTEPWAGHPVPTAKFFEQLLQALAWAVGPPLPVVPEASAELMLLRWITYHPAEAYSLRHLLGEYSCLPGLEYEGLVQLVLPVPVIFGAGGRSPFYPPRPGLIEPTGAGLDTLHRYRFHRETPKNLPAFITNPDQ